MGKYIPELIAYLTYAQNIFDFLDEKTEEVMLNRQEFNKERLHNEINNSCGHNNIDYSVNIKQLNHFHI